MDEENNLPKPPNPWLNYVNDKPVYTSLQVGTLVKTRLGYGNITEIYYNHVNGILDIYAKILIQSKGGIIIVERLSNLNMP